MPLPRPPARSTSSATLRRPSTSFAALLSILSLGACATDGDSWQKVPGADEAPSPSVIAPDAADAEPAQDLPEPTPDRFLADPGESLTDARALVVSDLGGALAQALAIHTRIVQAGRDDDRPFARAYLAELIERGIGVQYVGGDQGAWHLSHARTAPSAGGQIEYRLAAGPVTVSRIYRFANENEATAVSAMIVAGSRAPVELDADTMPAAALADRITYVDPPALSDPGPLVSLLGTSLAAGAPASGPSTIGTLQNVEIENLFYSSDPFAGIESTHRQVDRHVVVFANDSLVLGSDNRSLLYRFVDEKLGPADRLVLIGCSNGPTRAEGGNEALALGRSGRVTDALVAAGVERRRIDQQGCWAGSTDPNGLPGRGVVLDVWRPLSAGGPR